MSAAEAADEPPPHFFDEGFIPDLAVEGTREYPFTASNETAALFMLRQVRCSQIQRSAAARVAAGLHVDWDAWAYLLARERLWLAPGWYEHDDWTGPKCWRPVTAEALLLVGSGAPFKARADIPPKVLMIVERAVAAALAQGPTALSAGAIGRRLNLTSEFRREHRLWHLRAVDAPAGRSSSTTKEVDNMRKEKTRRAAGKMTRAEYLARAALIREACSLAGISRDTFDRRSPEEREQLMDAVRKVRAESAPLPSAESATVFAESVMKPVAESAELTFAESCSGRQINIDIGLAEQLSANEASGTGALESAPPNTAAAAQDRRVEAAVSTVNPPASPADRDEPLPDTMTADAGGRAEAPPPATVTSPTSRRYTIEPKPPVLVDGFDAQIWHWVRCGAHCGAARIQNLALAGARGRRAQVETFQILNDEHHLLAERMEPRGFDDEQIWRAIGAMDSRICELNAEAREMGVPLDEMSLPDEPPAPVPPSPDGRAWRAAA